MIRAEYACIIPVTLHLKGILLGNRSLKGCCLCVFPPCHMCNKMSDVRLSNASPTVERVDARQPDNVRAPVRRNLFGSPDPGEIHRQLTATIEEDKRSFKGEYNFDPVSEKPLSPGRYEWEEVNDAPEFYSRPPHGSRGVDSPGDGNRQDAEGSRERQPDRQPDRNGSRKRRSGAPGPCSNECPRKRSHSDVDEDEDPSNGAASQTVTATERGASSSERSAEVQ